MADDAAVVADVAADVVETIGTDPDDLDVAVGILPLLPTKVGVVVFFNIEFDVTGVLVVVVVVVLLLLLKDSEVVELIKSEPPFLPKLKSDLLTGEPLLLSLFSDDEESLDVSGVMFGTLALLGDDGTGEDDVRTGEDVSDELLSDSFSFQ